MNFYEEKKAARIERMRDLATKKAEFAANNGLDLFGETKSGIPMGQPILVGHHSEKRHRKHLERIENKVRKGLEAADQAKSLKQRAAAAESRTAIDSDNPNAIECVKAKMKELEFRRDRFKLLNSLVRKHKTPDLLALAIKEAIPETQEPEAMALQLLTPDFAGRIGIPDYQLTNMGAEIRRLKKRIPQLEVVQAGFDPFVVHLHGCVDIGVELLNGQIQIEFPWKPDEETRTKLKRLAFKWSRFSSRWVRKHTASTSGTYFIEQLKIVLREAKQ